MHNPPDQPNSACCGGSRKMAAERRRGEMMRGVGLRGPGNGMVVFQEYRTKQASMTADE